jgi:peptide/nickel transport system substrate-binding protein
VLQLAVNQATIVRDVAHGYGWATWSPLPPVVPTSVATKVADPYPFDVGRARSLLAAHGWRLRKGTETCESTTCGTGITVGTTFSLNLVAPSGNRASDTTIALERADWQRLGIDVTDFGCGVELCDYTQLCAAATSQLCTWGGGWIYASDYYPSGEALLTPSGSFDEGRYDSAEMTSLIAETVAGDSNLTAYAHFAAQQLPVLYQPVIAPTIEVARSLTCVTATACALNPLSDFQPEYFGT